MPGKMEAALSWAARGFPVFPIIAGGKKPREGFDDFSNKATTDPTLIRLWWTVPVVGGESEDNVGVATDAIVVLDVDTKKGSPGLEQRPVVGRNEWDTLTVRTPSGGYHEYFAKDPALLVGQAPVMRGLDIRSHHGYVLAPGSEVWENGALVGRYDLVVDAPLRPLPEALKALLKPPRAKSLGVDRAVIETPEAVITAEHFLREQAPLAIEGAWGDTTTFMVAAKMRGIGVEEATALRLMLELWNERCSPPWSPHELEAKISNAYEYASGAPGDENVLAAFVGVVVPEIEAAKVSGAFGFGNALPAAVIKPRPWLVRGFMLERSVTTIVGAGGTNKSTLTLTAAALLTVGRNLWGMEAVKPCGSVIYNAEDDLEEQSRRLEAICIAYQLDWEMVKSRIMLLSSDMLPLMLAAGSPSRSNEAHVKRLVECCSHPDVGLLGLDPLVEIHGCVEEDNVAMKYVMALIRDIARQTNTAVVVSHHTRKPSAGGHVIAGDVNSSRGAGSIINSARVAKTLSEPTAADLDRYAIAEADARKYVRMDDAKGNYSLASPSALWFKRLDVKITSGDGVGVLVPTNIQANADGVAMSTMKLLYADIVARQTSQVVLSEAATMLRSVDPMAAKLEQKQVIERLAHMFGEGVADDEGMGLIVRHEAKGRSLALWSA